MSFDEMKEASRHLFRFTELNMQEDEKMTSDGRDLQRYEMAKEEDFATMSSRFEIIEKNGYVEITGSEGRGPIYRATDKMKKTFGLRFALCEYMCLDDDAMSDYLIELVSNNGWIDSRLLENGQLLKMYIKNKKDITDSGFTMDKIYEKSCNSL